MYDAAWSGDRKLGANGKLSAMGSAVNAKDASDTNAFGAPTLSARWKAPAFDAKQRASNYVRVLETPAPRWTTFEAKIFGVTLPTDVLASIQEHAYTSPICTPLAERYQLTPRGVVYTTHRSRHGE